MTNTDESVTDLIKKNKSDYFRRTYETHKRRNTKRIARD